MGKRKKLEQQTRRRQKLCLSPGYSDENEDYEDETVSAPSVTVPEVDTPNEQGNLVAHTSKDETLEQFLKEINDLVEVKRLKLQS